MRDRVHALEEILNDIYAKIERKDKSSILQATEAELKTDDVTWDNYRYLEMCGPYGVGNPKPIFLIKNVTPKSIRRFGKAKEHVELVLPRGDGGSVSAVRFFDANFATEAALSKGKTVNLLANLEKNTFSRPPGLRLRIVGFV